MHELKDDEEPNGLKKVFAVVHAEHEVVAGFAAQLAGAIRACREMDDDLAKLMQAISPLRGN